MGIRPYIDDDLAAGRLVAPFALSVPKGMRWYLVYRSFQTEQRDFAAFRRWIFRAAAGSASRGKSARQGFPPRRKNRLSSFSPRKRQRKRQRKRKEAFRM